MNPLFSAIETADLTTLRKIADQLFTGNRLDIDTMRDFAKSLDGIIMRAIPLDEKGDMPR